MLDIREFLLFYDVSRCSRRLIILKYENLKCWGNIGYQQLLKLIDAENIVYKYDSTINSSSR